VSAEEQIPAHIAEMEVIGGMFDSFTISSWDPDTDRLEFFYGDRKNTIHHMVFQDGEFTRLWRSPPLGGTIQNIEIADLDNNGQQELVTYTAKNEAQIWDYEERYKIRWESRREANFTTIQSMTVADVDSDPAMEIIFCADNRIWYFDGASLIVEREGRDEVNAARILVGNVDGDPDDELITSDGFVIGTRSLNIEWAAPEPFGDPMYLYDFDGDGAFELIGQQFGAIKAWNIRERREIW
jgi:WD40 repeat protein